MMMTKKEETELQLTICSSTCTCA